MTTDTNTKKNLPKFKRHKLLKDLDTRLKGQHITDEFEVCGAKFKLRTLSGGDEDWADGYVKGANFYQSARSRRAPYLAAALVAMYDDEEDRWVPFEELIVADPDALTSAEAEVLEDEALAKEAHRAALIEWILNEDKNGNFIQELYSKHVELEKRRDEAMENMVPLSKSLRTGG